MEKSRPVFIIKKRDSLLAESDWTQLQDSPLSEQKKQEWAAYRQLLRDVPAQENFPKFISWPVKPN